MDALDFENTLWGPRREMMMELSNPDVKGTYQMYEDARIGNRRRWMRMERREFDVGARRGDHVKSG